MRLIEKIKELFVYLINYCDCPFDPDDNPFPQSCDKQTINTEWCENECPWRKRFNKDIMEVTAELWLEIADNIEILANQAVEDYKKCSY